MTLLRQSAWFTLGNLWVAALQLLLSVFFIRLLGIEAFGEWVMVWATITLCSLASAGIGPGMSLRLQSAANSLVRSVELRNAYEATLVLAAAIFIPAAAWLLHSRGQTPALHGAWLWLPLMFGQILANESVALSAAALRGLGDYRTHAITQCLVRSLWSAGVIALAMRQASLDAMLLVTVACTFAQASWLLRSLQRAGITLTPPNGMPARDWTALFGTARWQWLKTAGEMLYGSIDRLLINQFLGSGMLAVYVVCLQLTEPVQRLAAMLTQPLLLWAGRITDGEQDAGPDQRWLLYMQLPILLAGIVMCGVAPLLLPLWLGERAAHFDLAVRIAALAATLTALHAMANELQTGLGMLPRLAVANVIGALLTLLAMAMAIHREGLDAVMLARCVFGLCLAMTWPAVWRRVRRKPF